MPLSQLSSALSSIAALSLILLLGCRYDPVPEQKLDDLPAEDPAGPSELHRQGQPCVLCHSEYEGADPELAFGGTIYELNPATFDLIPVQGVFVTIFDSSGASQKACSNSAGNFFVRMDDWPDSAFPLTVLVGNRLMRGLIGRERSCAACHKLASVARVDTDPTVNTATGQGRDSAGAILVEREAIPLEEQCGPNPAASAVSAGAGGGGSGGAGGSDGAGGGGGNP